METILCGDALEQLRTMEAESVHYWQMATDRIAATAVNYDQITMEEVKP